MTTNNQDIVKRFASKGVFPYQMAFTLLIPLRNIFLSPRKLVKRLQLEPHFQVMEVGSGPGYFSPHIARKLTRGRLFLADIQPEMLAYARKRLTRRGLANVEYYLCDGNQFNFPDQVFDRIFMVTVIGEIENKAEYIREFARMMKPGGILSVSELAGDPDKLTVDELKSLFEGSGFEVCQLFGNERNYTLNFRRV